MQYEFRVYVEGFQEFEQLIAAWIDAHQTDGNEGVRHLDQEMLSLDFELMLFIFRQLGWAWEE